jgi:hypothetical protein
MISHLFLVAFEILRAVTMKNTLLSDVMPCSRCRNSPKFRRNYRVLRHFQYMIIKERARSKQQVAEDRGRTFRRNIHEHAWSQSKNAVFFICFLCHSWFNNVFTSRLCITPTKIIHNWEKCWRLYRRKSQSWPTGKDSWNWRGDRFFSCPLFSSLVSLLKQCIMLHLHLLYGIVSNTELQLEQVRENYYGVRMA